MDTLILKIKNIFKQYGFKGFILRVIKKVLSWIGIRFNRYYYLINDIDYDVQVEYWRKNGKNLNVNELTYADFLLGDPYIFNNKKLITIKERLRKGSYKAWGIMVNGELIISCWLSFKELRVSNSIINEDLNSDECLMLDAYCTPDYRGRGLHGNMCAYRLMKAYEAGREKCITIVLNENRVSTKSLLKVGFKKSFTYFTLTIWGKSYTNFRMQKRNLLDSLTNNL